MISMIPVIFGPYLKGLQSYMARFRFVIAIIFSPFCGHRYLVQIVILIAIIYGPFHKNYYNHMWSGPIAFSDGIRVTFC